MTDHTPDEAPALSVAAEAVETIVDRCIRRHGGFGHGNHGGFCPSCREAIALLSVERQPEGVDTPYSASREWKTLFNGIMKDDVRVPDVERAVAFLRIWANSYLLRGVTWDIPQTMGGALNHVIAIIESALSAASGLGLSVERQQPSQVCFECGETLPCEPHGVIRIEHHPARDVVIRRATPRTILELDEALYLGSPSETASQWEAVLRRELRKLPQYWASVPTGPSANVASMLVYDVERAIDATIATLSPSETKEQS